MVSSFVLVLQVVLALAGDAAPSLSARWARPGVARLEWSVPAGVVETCVVRRPAAGISVLIGCWYNLPAGETGLSLGDKGPIDGSFRPTAGDTFELRQDNQTVSAAQLRSLLLLPLIAH